MKIKLTTLLFGLLLAVGWTSNASAQKLPDKSLADELTAVDVIDAERRTMDAESADGHIGHSHSATPAKNNKRRFGPFRSGQELDMKSVTKAQADSWTYDWYDANNSKHTSKFSEVAKDPYQMYELLRQIYMDKRFPGPTYSAYTKNDVRERKVYYGAIQGGWDIEGPGTPVTSTIQASTYNDIVINVNVSSGSYYNYARIYSIKILSGNSTISSWDYATNGRYFPDGWTLNGTWSFDTSNYLYTSSNSNTLVFSKDKLKGHENVTVEIVAHDYNYNATGYRRVYVNGSYKNLNSSDQTLSWPIDPSGQEVQTVNGVFGVGNITISGNNRNAAIKSIKVTSGSTTLFNWSYAENGRNFTPGLDVSSTYSYNDTYGWICFNTNLDPYKLYGWLFGNHNNVTVTITGYNRGGSSADPASIIVNGVEQTIPNTYTSNDNPQTYTWVFNGQAYPHTDYDPDYYKPTEEGYTALIVAVKNHTTHPATESQYDGRYFYNKADIINYFTNNIDSIQLLVDGMRIGKGSDYSIGTVFNCGGTYNKFFFLGKGQAKQKPDVVRETEIYMQHDLGEYVPFKYMFEQFSPTGLQSGDQTENFYSLMNEGNVYSVVHDCRSVIELGHQFSMSGNAGETAYAMTGMNFFIPDYRLKYWTDTYTYHEVDYNVDGRIVNPYQRESSDGNPEKNQSLMFDTHSLHSAWYTNYNQDYAPKVGLYKITLEAVATAIDYDYNEGNRNYAVTLSWVSSLNEMTGHDVEQIYTVYYWDPVTGEKKYVEAIGITDGKTGLTTITYLVEQFATSYKLDYIVEGTPNDGNEHPQWVAVSNIDGVVIPGWNDFVGLKLDHHESDFVVNDMANWYRNFLVVVNEDVANGLTIDQITDPENPMNEFKLYRFEYDENDQPINSKPIATVTFSNPTPEQVNYTVTYDGINQQQQYKPEDNVHKYDLDENHLDVPLTGIVRIKGNGDIVIWPNGYHVNFKSIVIKDNGTVVASWNADEDNTLPNGWYMSSGSKWEEYITTNTGDKVGYVEGGGYIYIPNMLNNSNYTNLTVEIVAYGDGAAVTRIAVNDKTLNIANTTGVTYTWGTNETPLSPAAAPRRDMDNVNNNNSNN